MDTLAFDHAKIEPSTNSSALSDSFKLSESIQNQLSLGKNSEPAENVLSSTSVSQTNSHQKEGVLQENTGKQVIKDFPVSNKNNL